jgi:hypothetical protein
MLPKRVPDTVIRKNTDVVQALKSCVADYESSSVNKNDKGPLKQRRAARGNGYQKIMAYKRPRMKYRVLLVYPFVGTAPRSRCEFFDVLSTSIDCARTRLDIVAVRITEHGAPVVKAPYCGTGLCALDNLSCLAVWWDWPRLYLRVSSAQDL